MSSRTTSTLLLLSLLFFACKTRKPKNDDSPGKSHNMSFIHYTSRLNYDGQDKATVVHLNAVEENGGLGVPRHTPWEKVYKNRVRRSSPAPKVHVKIDLSGTTQVAYEYAKAHPGKKIGIIVAGNSGLPGGNVGHPDKGLLKKGPGMLKKSDGGQEEDIVSNWITTMFASEFKTPHVETFSLLKDKWGLKEPVGASHDLQTIQGVDYKNNIFPENYGDVWVVRNVLLSKHDKNSKTRLEQRNKLPREYSIDETFKANLFFVAGPNANCSNTPQGSTFRTCSKKANEENDPEFPFFRDSIKQTMKTALDGMAKENIDVVFMAKVSGGIYLGKKNENSTRARKAKFNNAKYEEMINSVLEEAIDGVSRREYFDKVFFVDIQP